MTLKEFIDQRCPRIKEIIENRKNQPTEEERITALEMAIAELALKEE